MSIILYGIKNCDTVKKARRWLETQQIEYIFHDFRVDGLKKNLLEDILKHIDYETLLNKRGTTWRKLTEEQKSKLTKTRAITLMLEYPALIKRPVLDVKGRFHIGFKDEQYRTIAF